MRSRNCAHRLRRRVVVEKNPAAAVDLQVDETRRQQRAGWHHFHVGFGIDLAARRDMLDQALTDQNGGIVVPSNSVKDAVGGDDAAPLR